MNIVITGTGFSFPDGTGATTRVMAFAKGLMSHGATVHVFCLKPTESRVHGGTTSLVTGVYEGIPYEYTCGRRIIAKTRVGALLLYLKGLRQAVLAIQRIHRKTPVDAILLWYAEYPLNFLVFKLLTKFLGAPLIAEKSECPFVYLRKTLSVRMNMWFNEHVTYRWIDGVIVISTFLQKFFEAHADKAVKILNVPILVESGNFAHGACKGTSSTERKIIYCGNLEHTGEVEELLMAFSQVAAEFPEWCVEVIGPLPHLRPVANLKKMIERLGLVGRVTFAGAVARSDIPRRLNAGDVMALPRASGIFSTAGFPTKLGEYLVSGKPVVVTATGDIPVYLKDGVSAYLVPPDDLNAFAERLRYVISHPLESAEVGLRGRDVALCEFDSGRHAKRILSFIDVLLKAQKRV